MGYPADLLYTKEHIWIQKLEDGLVRIGITDYAQEQLGDILFVDLPEEGSELVDGDTLTEIESSKTATELATPVAGEITAVNEELDDSPETINEHPYEAWIVEVKTDDDLSGFLSAKEYEDGLEE